MLGFSDINYLQTDRDVEGGFVSGQMVGHVVAGLTDRLAFSTELSATARSTGYALEVERFILRYDLSDILKLSAGRYHTPVSYWNTAFHHGLWLQTSVGRPEMVKFGSQFIPVHFVGLLAEGMLPGPTLGLGYTAGLGNGRHENIARAGDAGDVNDHRAWIVGLTARPALLFGLQVGASMYKDRVPAEAGAVDEAIYSAHVVWFKERPELISEYAHIRHENVEEGGDYFASNGYYVQLGYRLSGVARLLKPYVRYEQVDTASGDPVFSGLGLDYEAAVIGVRFDFAPFAALKGEYRNERFQDLDRSDSFFVQLAFTFPALLAEGEPQH